MKFLTLAFLMIMVALASAGCANPSGFQTTFTSNSFNVAGGQSAYESGIVNIDFVGQRASSVFEIDISGGEKGSGLTWNFGANPRRECYEASSSAQIPSGFPKVLKDIGSLTFGKFPVEMLEVESDTPALNQSVVFDLTNCVMVSSYLINADESNPGYGTINFFNVGVPSDSDFQLPQVCIDAVGSSRPKIGFNHKHRIIEAVTPISKTLQYTLNTFKIKN
ncbi:hypothetical protein CYY_004518 [Polysphondylium violaceum]|uniref:Uncharacterized protein n=1 Tax=Polysphondylium violaceum TaxID=133409 RepID=A0A8J4V7P5_9MYCE|nr:hypothetical protein CYY_004518 [Polysphondylium violaceum]